MHAPADNITSSRSGPPARPAGLPPDNLVGIWAQGRRRITPWAYPYLRALAAVRLAVGIFLIGLGTVMLAHGHYGWAAVPLAAAALLFSIAYLDFAVARSAPRRS
jgi:hypothetical protein